MAEIISMPKLGFDMAEGKLVRWAKKVGETVNKGEVLAEIETDKATVEVESSASGFVRSLLVDEGAVVPVNTPIALVGSADETIEEPMGHKTDSNHQKVDAEPMRSRPEPGAISSVPSDASGAFAKASPLARKIASDNKMDLSAINGTGPGGRIVRRDIETALGSQKLAVVSSSSVNDHTSSATDETMGMPKLRQAIARRMTEAKTSIPHFYVTHEYKMDALIELRTQFNKIVLDNERLSVNDFIIKAVALTLRKFPNLNASLNGKSVVQYGSVNIGMAVSVEGGLLTIVCKDADAKPLRQIAAEVKAMAVRARDGKVKANDIEGSTFSISNLGMFDVENFIAIINPPEAAILAVSSACEVAVAENGAVLPGWRMKATISVDHRLSDGVEAAKFMQALAVFLEEPLRLVV
jgi:pyruvate dehydrogenase E2 component (dihydrolipoamide acetyltransferase)